MTGTAIDDRGCGREGEQHLPLRRLTTECHKEGGSERKPAAGVARGDDGEEGGDEDNDAKDWTSCSGAKLISIRFSGPSNPDTAAPAGDGGDDGGADDDMGVQMRRRLQVNCRDHAQ